MRYQFMLWLENPDTKQKDRLINVELMSAAHVHPSNPEWTEVISGVCQITIHMPFAEFSKHLEKLIADNYRTSTEIEAQWHKKRMADTEVMMKEVMGNLHGK